MLCETKFTVTIACCTRMSKDGGTLRHMMINAFSGCVGMPVAFLL